MEGKLARLTAMSPGKQRERERDREGSEKKKTSEKAKTGVNVGLTVLHLSAIFPQ